MHRRRVWWWARRWQRSRWVSCDAASTPGRRHRLANDADRRRQVRDHVITAELTSARRRTPSCSTIVGRARRLFQNASDSSSKSNGRQEQPAATWRHRITDSVTTQIMAEELRQTTTATRVPDALLLLLYILRVVCTRRSARALLPRLAAGSRRGAALGNQY